VVPSVVQVQLENCEPELRIIYPEERATADYQAPKPWSERECQ
jgi:hypothetical protein